MIEGPEARAEAKAVLILTLIVAVHFAALSTI